MQYLPRIIPSLFTLIAQVITKDNKVKDESTKINTYETEEADVAIAMLDVFITELCEDFKPYVEKASELIVPLCNSM